MERAFVPSSHTHHREVGARLFHEMELELVSLPCQTVNSLGAATRAINPLLVLQFSTQPRTAINNRPLSKVDHNPRRFLVDFQKFHRSPSVALLFFSLSLSLPSSPSCEAGRRSPILTTTRKETSGVSIEGRRKSEFFDR